MKMTVSKSPLHTLAAEYIGSTATPVQEPAYKGVPAAVTNVVAASSLTQITLTFDGAGE